MIERPAQALTLNLPAGGTIELAQDDDGTITVTITGASGTVAGAPLDKALAGAIGGWLDVASGVVFWPREGAQ